jgi:hypothetical protein
MAKGKDVNDSLSVTEHIQKLDPVLGALVEKIRQIILTTHKEIGERIKWNSPSFFYIGAMKPFNPKEYKRELIVFNLHNRNYALLVLPSGAKLKDTSGLLEGDYKDGRRLVKIYDLADADAKAKTLQQLIKQWLKMIDK